ncbi:MULTISPECIES: GNAT family N-acetyltransferase [Streptomyces]|uniref:GNAT family N-acetyltransferase n=1 Tax=Streptomyces tsukubensis (strain DSM 42081 / NBRC 108919 / NRRL 18488 / 9993) TaxID=1114943 RepID=I2N0U9_STRT9|nr:MULTISPECIES: GNAT family N-acetyltransferase [Streptomyces]AZK94840.1 N-acetyltransferase [Streptomyces tsukubensis]EIF90646.1 putative acetyltransferase [Streptomyces tsukubensis NRRL18488]MYS66998.1 GNAT family N-acetyltransferase [Streptomyces sp. SID5473]QKM69078.1 GNAT family N-acetyltransferase [Streptomyces tsukubensis NRRL18488]TAI40699.1 GNAT family N-acetyltransferase [Streptomyces tsukubensis]
MIRTAQPADVPEVHRMILALAEHQGYRHEVRATEEQLREALFGAAPAVHAFVAVDEDGALAGFALWFLTYSTWRGVHGIYLEDLYVDPARRGGGHGKALIAALARTCTERGYQRLEWSVLDKLVPTIAFYRSLGARPLEDSKVFRLTDAELEELAAYGQ